LLFQSRNSFGGKHNIGWLHSFFSSAMALNVSIPHLPEPDAARTRSVFRNRL